MKNTVLSLIILLSCVQVKGQTLQNAYNYNTPQVVYPTPQSQLYEKRLDCPVSYETGIPDISIPLYTIEVDGLKIPINLSYYAGGVKYDQYDGDIGVGWTLTPGYRVTRKCYAKPDESSELHPDIDDIEDTLYTQGNYFWTDRYLASFHEHHPLAPVSSVNNKFYDSEYDQFTYMLPTGSAHFVLSDRQNKQTTILEKTNNTIELVTLGNSYDSGYDIRQFNITDDKGFIYKIGGENTIKEWVMGVGYNSNNCATAWPLSQITTPTEKNIHFSYVQGTFSKVPKGQGVVTICDETYGMPQLVSGRYLSTNEDTRAFSLTTSTFFLSGINTDKEYININRETRSDLNYRITSIEIYRKQPTQTLIKKIKFNYSTQNHHKILVSVDVCAQNGSTVIESYSFTYYPGNTLSTSFPDQWGYYCHSGSSYRSPDFGFYHSEFLDDYVQGDSKYTPRRASSVGAFTQPLFNRSSNNTSAMHGYSLKSITFPTKGCWEFSYEPHQYMIQKGGGQRIKQIKMLDHNNSTIK
ncbi:hypothetical protein LJC05_04340, partial [Bacteroides sp. OttesenSCG-928-J23]|nr:hypothetical protein [Bacteroides sp. OttesenSCG-928-J23]